MLRDVETNGERNRLLYILKSAKALPIRTQVREFLITSKGVKLVDAYLGADGVLTGVGEVEPASPGTGGADGGAGGTGARKKLSLAHRRKAVEAQIENPAPGVFGKSRRSLIEFQPPFESKRRSRERLKPGKDGRQPAMKAQVVNHELKPPEFFMKLKKVCLQAQVQTACIGQKQNQHGPR